MVKILNTIINKRRIYKYQYIILKGCDQMYYTLEDYLRRKKGMKLFISWSGDKSRKIAELLKILFHKVVQSLEPWVSSEDIETGSVWFSQICNEIREVCNSVIVVTKENKENPWIMFEAGALCRGDDTNRVNIVLVDLEPSEIRAPLSAFNLVRADEDGLRRLMHNLNKRLLKEEPDFPGKITEQELDEGFNHYYSDFKKKFDEVMIAYPKTEHKVKTESEIMQEETLLAVRGIEQVLLDARQQIRLNTLNMVLDHYAAHNNVPKIIPEVVREQMFKSYFDDIKQQKK